MDLLWFVRYRRGGGTQSFPAWETAAGTSGYEDASAPAKAGRKLAVAVTRKAPADRTARAMTNVMHWATGTQWGAVYGVLAVGSARRHRAVLAAGFPFAVFGTSYLLLGLAGIYQPIWTYDRATLAKDLTAHLTYGAVTAATFAALGSRGGLEARP